MRVWAGILHQSRLGTWWAHDRREVLSERQTLRVDGTLSPYVCPVCHSLWLEHRFCSCAVATCKRSAFSVAVVANFAVHLILTICGCNNVFVRAQLPRERDRLFLWQSSRISLCILLLQSVFATTFLFVRQLPRERDRLFQWQSSRIPLCMLLAMGHSFNELFFPSTFLPSCVCLITLFSHHSHRSLSLFRLPSFFSPAHSQTLPVSKYPLVSINITRCLSNYQSTVFVSFSFFLVLPKVMLLFEFCCL